MRLHVLGSGSCMIGQEERTPCGYALETPQGVVLVDTGPGTSRNIPRAGLDVADIVAVVHTHRHPDHVSDITPILQDVYVETVFYGEDRADDLALVGPEGHRDYLDQRLEGEMAQTLEGVSEEQPFAITLHELEPGTSHTVQGMELSAVAAEHGGDDFPALAIRVTTGDGVVAFTGDTGYADRLVEVAHDADLLVTDCSHPDGEGVEGHMTPSACGRLAAAAGVKTLLLSHFYPAIDTVDPVAQAQQMFDGPIVAAKDLLRVEV